MVSDKFIDNQYESCKFEASQVPHSYGDNFFLVFDPLALTQLAILSSPEYRQPEFNHRIAYLYENLLGLSLNSILKPVGESVETRMQGYKWTGPQLSGRFVTVAVARAGNLPSSLLFDRLSFLLNTEHLKIQLTFNLKNTEHP